LAIAIPGALCCIGILFWKRLSPRTGTSCLLVSTILFGLGGCDRSHGTIPRMETPESSSGFNLTLWTNELDLGLLPTDRESTAEFVVENTGSEIARLQLGIPTCTCSSAKLDKPELKPG
jgi:hypothetical protein